ncbi:het domain-containing protein [Seiridium cupressi]
MVFSWFIPYDTVLPSLTVFDCASALVRELLAPKRVLFFDKLWEFINVKQRLSPLISIITKIDETYITGARKISEASLAQRMSWAAGRQTTRIEDRAYCLLGLFDMSMPMLYGEGKKAIQRLQQEIVRVSTDSTLLAWGLDHHNFDGLVYGVLPSGVPPEKSKKNKNTTSECRRDYEIWTGSSAPNSSTVLALDAKFVAIPLVSTRVLRNHSTFSEFQYTRFCHYSPQLLSQSFLQKCKYRLETIGILKIVPEGRPLPMAFSVNHSRMFRHRLRRIYPPQAEEHNGFNFTQMDSLEKWLIGEEDLLSAGRARNAVRIFHFQRDTSRDTSPFILIFIRRLVVQQESRVLARESTEVNWFNQSITDEMNTEVPSKGRDGVLGTVIRWPVTRSSTKRSATNKTQMTTSNGLGWMVVPFVYDMSFESLLQIVEDLSQAGARFDYHPDGEVRLDSATKLCVEVYQEGENLRLLLEVLNDFDYSR